MAVYSNCQSFHHTLDASYSVFRKYEISKHAATCKAIYILSSTEWHMHVLFSFWKEL